MSNAPKTLPSGRRKKGCRTMKEKKPNIFKRLKYWWKEELTDDDRDIFKIAGIYFVDGIMIGAAVTAGAKNKKNKTNEEAALTAGYIKGKMDAYKEIAENSAYPRNFQQNNANKF